MAITLCGKCMEEVEQDCMCEDNPYHQRAVRDGGFAYAFVRKMFDIP